MERQSTITSVFAAAICLIVLLATPARAQEPRVLYGTIGGLSFASGPISTALRDLDITPIRAANSQEFLDELRFGRWDLVIFRSKQRFLETIEFEIITELEAHVASGGKLHFQMADLDSAPQELLDVLGVAEAIELRFPLSDIWAPLPTHPSVPGFGFLGLRGEFFPPDYGDILIPGPSAYVTQTFGESGPASTVVAQGGRVLVNGQQWDNWDDTSSGFAEAQIAWLLGCPADLDGDGELTVFDFLEFQNLFDAGDVRADTFYDGHLDIFDFLEFFNQFDAGCH